MPEELILRVRRFFKTYYTVRTMVPERDVLSNMPDALRQEVLIHMADPNLKRCVCVFVSVSTSRSFPLPLAPHLGTATRTESVGGALVQPHTSLTHELRAHSCFFGCMKVVSAVAVCCTPRGLPGNCC